MFPSKGLSMRTPAFLSCALSLLALASPALLRAQFQEPTQDELKMTADPKAPGADAVYLYREETTDDSLHFHSYYERIKILTEKGKELATISTPYERGPFKVTDIKGRTIHADGSIVLLTAKPTDLMDEKTKGLQVNTMVFTLPSAEVGSILEYRLQLRYDDNLYVKPSWQIQQPYFVHKAHYMFNPPHLGAWESISDTSGHNLDRLMYSAVALPLASVVAETVGRYTVDLSDIPPTPREDWMPPLNTINERIEFYYTYARSAKDYWDSEGKHWAKETERFTNPGREVKDTVDQIVSTSDSEEQKARKIYAAVMKIDNTDFSRAKSDAERKAEKLKPIKNAEDVWKQKAGSGGLPASKSGRCRSLTAAAQSSIQVISSLANWMTTSPSLISAVRKRSLIPARKCVRSASCTGSTTWPPVSGWPKRALFSPQLPPTHMQPRSSSESLMLC
jgi:hypothetical protein